MATAGKNQWRRRYDKSIEDEASRIAEAEANESEWSKLLNRSAYTGTALDLLILPFVLVFFGIPALRRHLRNRR
ncbi:hypothetical protein [Ilumatobacter sp.]|jgi:hypothetical protein|uniref:hypothetical protein n=1 Tax=Ilumatobacter sp. TaxID=1967498 RepID=UPI0037511766